MRALRARVYAPKSVDATETTVLTPRSGAPHSEAFQVATVQGLSGYRPYLDRVVGRAGSIDPLTKSVDVGVLSLVLGDIRTGTSDTSRWLTAFCGDSAGRWALPACRVEVDECLNFDPANPTVGWNRYFTGRTEPLTAESLLRRGMRVRDLSTDLDQPVFDGSPHPDVASYAARARLWPLGTPIAWGPFPAQSPITMEVIFDDGTFMNLQMPGGSADTTDAIPRVGTRALRGLAYQYVIGVSNPPALQGVRAFVAWTSGAGALNGTTQEYAVVSYNDVRIAPTDASSSYMVESVFLRRLSGGAAVPASGAVGSVWIEVSAETPPSEALPLFISDVHPVQFWRDLLDGYFGQLNATTGDPDFPVAYDSAAFATLIADTSFPDVRFLIDERADSLRDFIEEELCAPFHLTYRIDAEGRVVPIDLRRPTSTPTSIAIGSSDLLAVPDRAVWEPGGAAVGRLQATYYVDRSVDDNEFSNLGRDPEVPPARVQSVEQRVTVLSPSARGADLARKPVSITSRGLRAGNVKGVTSELPGTRVQQIQQQMAALAAELDEPFGLGPMYVVLRCARGTGRPAESAVPGSWVSVTCAELENPATVQRTGTRLMRCVEVSDEGEQGLERRLRLLDPGPNPVAGPPNPPTAASVFGTPTTTGGVVRFTMPASNLPAFLRIMVNSGVYGPDIAVTAGVGATQDVTLDGLTPGTSYTVAAYGLSSTGVASTTTSPSTTLTTDAPTTIPTPTLSGYTSGAVHTLTIAPGGGSPSGITWVIQQDGVDYDTTIDTTYLALPAPGTWDWTVYGTKSGYDDSAVSNTVTLP